MPLHSWRCWNRYWFLADDSRLYWNWRKNEEEVYKIVDRLGYKKSDITVKDVESIYKDYGIELNKIKILELEENRKWQYLKI